MFEEHTNVDLAEPESTTLQELYKATQDQLVLTIERSLDSGKKDLAGRLDDVLLRQKFWEEDIRLEDGALPDLEANDTLASSIIRYYLDEIRHQLQDVIRAISSSSEYVQSFLLGCIRSQRRETFPHLSGSNWNPTDCDQ